MVPLLVPRLGPIPSHVFSTGWPGATYEQLARAIQGAIRKGRIPAGGKLLPSRELASQLKVSRNTVVSAYELLCSQQWARSRHGSGTFVMRAPGQKFVCGLEIELRHRPDIHYVCVIHLTAVPVLECRRSLRPPVRRARGERGAPQIWRSHLLRAVRETKIGYPVVQGLLELREEICRYLARRRGFACSPKNVIIVSGTQQALALALRVLVDEGDSAVIEDPCYRLLSDTVRVHGARVFPTPVDDQGLECSDLPASRPSLIWVTPSHQFPSGAIMSQPRREELLRYATKYSSWIIEDDYDGEFRYDTAQIPALRSLDAGERVLYVGSFSKTLFPGMRLGYVICPSGLLEDLRRAKRYDDLGCGSIEQHALATFMHSGAFERRLRKVMLELRKRRAALIEALRRHCSRSADQRLAFRHAHGRVAPALYLAATRCIAAGVATAQPRGRAPHRCLLRDHSHERPGLLLGVASLSAAQLRVSARLLGEAVSEVRAR